MQAHYQILLIILFKEFIKSNVNMGMIKNKYKTCYYKDWECCLGYINVKDDLLVDKCLYCNRN